MTPGPDGDRLAEWEALWGLIARILAFVLGAFLATYEVVLAQGDSVYFRVVGTMAGVAMMGPVVAVSFGIVLDAWRGRGS